METVLVLVEEQEELAKVIQLNKLVIDSVELPLDYRYASSTREDIEMFRLLDLDADDDNESVLEDILEPKDSNNTLLLSLLNGLKEG